MPKILKHFYHALHFAVFPTHLLQDLNLITSVFILNFEAQSSQIFQWHGAPGLDWDRSSLGSRKCQLRSQSVACLDAHTM